MIYKILILLCFNSFALGEDTVTDSTPVEMQNSDNTPTEFLLTSEKTSSSKPSIQRIIDRHTNKKYAFNLKTKKGKVFHKFTKDECTSPFISLKKKKDHLLANSEPARFQSWLQAQALKEHKENQALIEHETKNSRDQSIILGNSICRIANSHAAYPVHKNETEKMEIMNQMKEKFIGTTENFPEVALNKIEECIEEAPVEFAEVVLSALNFEGDLNRREISARAKLRKSFDIAFNDSASYPEESKYIIDYMQKRHRMFLKMITTCKLSDLSDFNISTQNEWSYYWSYDRTIQEGYDEITGKVKAARNAAKRLESISKEEMDDVRERYKFGDWLRSVFGLNNDKRNKEKEAILAVCKGKFQVAYLRAGIRALRAKDTIENDLISLKDMEKFPEFLRFNLTKSKKLLQSIQDRTSASSAKNTDSKVISSTSSVKSEVVSSDRSRYEEYITKYAVILNQKGLLVPLIIQNGREQLFHIAMRNIGWQNLVLPIKKFFVYPHINTRCKS